MSSRVILCVMLLAPVPAAASETIIYSYDAKGRLVQVTHSGSVNNNLQTTYQHDAADNRKNVTVSGASH